MVGVSADNRAQVLPVSSLDANVKPQLPVVSEKERASIRQTVDIGLPKAEGKPTLVAQNFFQDRINDLRWAKNKTLDSINQAVNSEVGRNVLAPVRAVTGTAGDILNGVQQAVTHPRETIQATYDYLKQVPGAVVQLAQDPVGTLQNVYAGAVQTRNDAFIEVIKNAYPGMSPSMIQNGIVTRDGNRGLVILDPVTGVIADIGDGRGGLGFQGFRVPLPTGGYSQPVWGRVTEFQGRPAVIDYKSNESVLLGPDGWHIRTKNNTYSSTAVPNAVVASLENADGSRTWGLVTQPNGVAPGNKIFLRDGGTFQIKQSEEQRYSRPMNTQDFRPVIQDNQVWAQDQKNYSLVMLDSQNKGVVRLPQSDGTFGEARTGTYVTNNIGGMKVPGVQLNNLPGVIELPDSVFRVKMPLTGLSEPMKGQPAPLKDPKTGNQGAGIVVSVEGGQVFYGTNGVQVKATNGNYTEAVVGGTPTYLDGKLSVIQESKSVRPELRGNLIITDEGNRIKRPDGNWSGAIPGTPTVLDGKPVVENKVANVRVVTDGASFKVSDPSGNQWTPQTVGKVVQLPNGTIGIQPKDREGAVVLPSSEKNKSIYAVYDPESKKWSKPILGDGLVPLDGGGFGVQAGTVVLHPGEKKFYRVDDPSKTWQSINPSPQPQIVPPKSGLQQTQEFLGDLALGIQYSFSSQQGLQSLGQELKNNSGGLLQGVGDAATALATVNGVQRESIQPGDPRYASYQAGKMITNFVGEGAISVTAVATAVPTGGGSLAVYGTYKTVQEINRRQNDAIAKGQDPTTALNPKDISQSIAIGAINTLATASVVPIGKLPVVQQIGLNATINTSTTVSTAALQNRPVDPKEVAGSVLFGTLFDLAGAKLANHPQGKPTGDPAPRGEMPSGMSLVQAEGQNPILSYSTKRGTRVDVEVGSNGEPRSAVVVQPGTKPGTQTVTYIKPPEGKTSLPRQTLTMLDNLVRAEDGIPVTTQPPRTVTQPGPTALKPSTEPTSQPVKPTTSITEPVVSTPTQATIKPLPTGNPVQSKVVEAFTNKLQTIGVNPETASQAVSGIQVKPLREIPTNVDTSKLRILGDGVYIAGDPRAIARITNVSGEPISLHNITGKGDLQMSLTPKPSVQGVVNQGKAPERLNQLISAFGEQKTEALLKAYEVNRAQSKSDFQAMSITFLHAKEKLGMNPPPTPEQMQLVASVGNARIAAKTKPVTTDNPPSSSATQTPPAAVASQFTVVQGGVSGQEFKELVSRVDEFARQRGVGGTLTTAPTLQAKIDKGRQEQLFVVRNTADGKVSAVAAVGPEYMVAQNGQRFDGTKIDYLSDGSDPRAIQKLTAAAQRYASSEGKPLVIYPASETLADKVYRPKLAELKASGELGADVTVREMKDRSGHTFFVVGSPAQVNP